ncbi:putative ABC transport system permease protein [Seleniivibrio woodruffii]|uniref:Putative ABC transport system permease protein n=2 Tax=Seleniivibrio woodruffii TaxID=1078050 RepID=A0A4R1KAG4_9BACT|nr:FtsX-like permease family protein [Seleniivibrio woodruffii]TCK61027.1 putative ABC transport system permease protein [Seleniivibrio woodruffii]TVZ36657.1 putative ABC transport system permease protein [Seleniivibrio woodruffii]
MNILTLPFRNLRRKLLRTGILVSVFALGILSVVLLYNVSTTVGHSLEQKMNEFGANIVIYPKTESLKISYGGFSLGNLAYQVKYLPEKETVDAIYKIPNRANISSVAPKLLELVQYKDKHVAVIGVQFTFERRIKSYWSINGKEPAEANEAIIGSKAAEHLGLKTGDSIPVGTGKFLITGILTPTGTEDDNIIFADLHSLQAAVNKPNMINYTDVSALCAGCPIEDIVQQIEQKLPDTEINAMQNIVKQRMATIETVQHLVLGLGGVILLTACFMLAMFMLASVNERKNEIGILRALGYSGAQIFLIFSIESLIIGAMAGVLGYVGGFFGSAELLKLLKLGEHIHIIFNWVHLLITVGAVSVLSAAASAFPALKAAQMRPTDAFSRI